MKRILSITVLLLVTVSMLNAQGMGRYRKGGMFRAAMQLEARLGIGMANSLAELGGANNVGTHFFRDYEIVMTRPAAYLGVRYYIPDSRFAATVNLLYARVSGRDNLTQDPYRQNRNLNFRSPILEFSGQMEFYFVKKRDGSRYKLRQIAGAKKVDMEWYMFLGIGGFWFNPKGQYNGNWYALQPIGTEGQNLVPTRRPYRRFSGCIPYGVGGKYGIDQNLSVGFEIGFRYTFTDYLDDVSTTYVDKTLMLANQGQLATNLADPSFGTFPTQTQAGEQRGDPRYKDMYMFFMFTVNYKLTDQRGRLPKFFSWASRF